MFVYGACFFVSTFLSAQSWSLAKEKNEVSVYTRKIEGWGIKEYKAVFVVKASLNKVVKVLKDVPGRYNWLHNTIEIREVERKGNAVSVYNLVDAPWPVSDRDNITTFTFNELSPTKVRVDMQVVKTHTKAPIYEGIVRIERLQGFCKGARSLPAWRWLWRAVLGVLAPQRVS